MTRCSAPCAARATAVACGFDGEREERLVAMLAGQNVRRDDADAS